MYRWGLSGKLGQYMVQHALDRGYEVVGVCREQSVEKLDRFTGRITVVPGATDDREVIKRAVAGCDGVLTVLLASNSGITDPIARELAPWFKDGIAPLNWFWEPEITTEIENQVQALVKGEALPEAAADAVQAKADQLRREGRSYFS